MTCTVIGRAIICTSPRGRLKLGNRYVWLDFHEWCGPSFSWYANGTKPYEPIDENDPIWPLFSKWLEKFNAAKAKRKAQEPKP